MNSHSGKKVVKVAGIDLAKNSFQLHGVDGAGNPVMRKKLTREKPKKLMVNMPQCRVAICGCPLLFQGKMVAFYGCPLFVDKNNDKNRRCHLIYPFSLISAHTIETATPPMTQARQNLFSFDEKSVGH